MKSELGKWMQSKLGQINDRATSSDWAAMEQLINATPGLAAKPWYQTGWGLGSIAGGLAVIATVGYFSLSTPEGSDVSTDAIVSEEYQDVPISPAEGESGQAVFTREDGSSLITSDVPDQGEEESIPPTSLASDEPIQEIPSRTTRTADPLVAPSGEQEEIGANPIALHPLAESLELNTKVNEEGEALSTPKAMTAHESELTPGSGGEATQNTPLEGLASAAQSPSTSQESSSSDETEGVNSLGNSGDESIASPTLPSIASQTDAESHSEAAESSMDRGSSDTESGSFDHNRSAAQPILLDARDENRTRWSIAAYADYDLNAPAPVNAEIQSSEIGRFAGYGMELEANWRNWTASTGFMMHRESSAFKTQQYFADTLRNGSNWYEIDTTYSQRYDSTWVNNGGNGYWDIDTVQVATPTERMVEGYGFSYTQTEVRSSIRTEGYRYSIPLLVGRQWTLDRWNVGVQAGPIFTLRSTSWFFDDHFNHASSDRSFDLLFRVEAGYSITPHFSLFGRAGLRTNTERISNLRQNAWTTRAIPVSLGMRYTF